MGDWPSVPVLGDTHTGVISTFSDCSLGVLVAAAPSNSHAWPAANDAIYVPFRLSTIETAYKMACGTGTATTGNFDLGIYDAAGNRLVSTGSTAKTTATSERVVDITDTVLYPGMYYMGMGVDTNAAAYVGWTVANAGLGKLAGLRQQATAFALPSSATFATFTAGFVPLIGVFLRSE